MLSTRTRFASVTLREDESRRPTAAAQGSAEQAFEPWLSSQVSVVLEVLVGGHHCSTCSFHCGASEVYECLTWSASPTLAFLLTDWLLLQRADCDGDDCGLEKICFKGYFKDCNNCLMFPQSGSNHVMKWCIHHCPR